MKIVDNFHCEWTPLRVYHKSKLFEVSKDEWDTKEGTGKSMKNALNAQQYGKTHLSG